jgi:hypothetical protein
VKDAPFISFVPSGVATVAALQSKVLLISRSADLQPPLNARFNQTILEGAS